MRACVFPCPRPPPTAMTLDLGMSIAVEDRSFDVSLLMDFPFAMTGV